MTFNSALSFNPNAVYLIINSLEAGGAEKLNINLSQHIKPSAIILLENKIEYDITSLKSRLISLCPFISIPGSFKYLITLFYAFRLASILKKESAPHLILIASLPRSYDVALKTKRILARKKKISVIIWEHASPEYYHRNHVLKSLSLFLYNKADIICANSKNACRYLNEAYNISTEKTATLYNFFNFENILASAHEKIILEHEQIFKHKTLLYLGRLHTQKGIEFLLQIFKILHQLDPSIHLVIIGKGELESFITKFIQSNKLQSHIHLLGFTSNPFPYLKLANALIFPSESEGFGNVIVESLIVGTPVLAADIDNGPREILAPNTDFRFRTQEPEFAEYGILLPSIKTNPDEQQVMDMWANTIYTFFQSEVLQKKYEQIDHKKIQLFDINHQTEILQSIISKL